MAFSPLKDYLGLNELAQRLKISTSEDEHRIQSGGCLIQHPPALPPKSRMDGPKLEDLDIIMMSRVYTSRLSNNARRRRRPLSHCVFCKNNLECPAVYESHKLKEASGKITCPILRAYTCPICGASGDYAHTIKYCPVNVKPHRI